MVHFHVYEDREERFEKFVGDLEEEKEDCVKGCNGIEGESFGKSEEFRKGRLEQDTNDVKHEGVW